MRSALKSVAVCSAVIALSGLALAQPATDAKKPPAAPTAPAKPAMPTPPKDKPAMPAMPEGAGMGDASAMMPGEMHKKLEPMVGAFDATVKFWAPGAPDMPATKGTSKSEWILDGRFIKEDFSGSIMNMPFKGLGHTGYNGVSKQFESTWMDSMSTGIMMSTGKISADGKTIDWTGTMDDPETGKKMTIRMITKITDANGHSMQMFGPGPDGKEFKMLEITYTRSGGASAKPDAGKPEAAKPAPGGNTAPTAPAKPK